MPADATLTIVPRPRGENPFRNDGVERDANGMLYYTGLPRSLMHVLRDHAASKPGEEALYEVGGERLTYREVWDRASKIAGGLRERGLGPGDRVAIHMPNGVTWVLALYGTIMAGGVAVPVNTRFSESEVEYVVNDSGARIAFHAGDELPQGDPYFDDSVDHDTIAAIFYTSGTTGFPKGATTTQGALLTNAENMLRCIGVDRDVPGRSVISVPLFHVTGCNAQLLSTMYLGGTSVILSALDLSVLISTIVTEKIDRVTTVPAVYALMISHPDFAGADVSHVEHIGYGGAPMAPALVHRVKEAFPNAQVRNGFGMTEGAALMTALPHAYAATHADSVGFACPTMDLALLDPDPETGVGELLVRGANVTRSYWNKPEATAAAIVDGWLHTGDMARIDDRGFTYIVDRKKDMINRGGENVYCVEVENAFIGLEGIAEVAVLGVPHEVLGEKVGAVIVPLPGATLDTEAIRATLRERIADFKVPQYVVLRPTPLPRNAGGKVLKTALKKEVTDWGPPLK
jgi:acyl-CoA synthetase (AMP-forming)/AMP-acid ligase II